MWRWKGILETTIIRTLQSKKNKYFPLFLVIFMSNAWETTKLFSDHRSLM